MESAPQIISIPVASTDKVKYNANIGWDDDDAPLDQTPYKLCRVDNPDCEACQ